MPRRRPRPPPPLDDRDLAAEVLYLHSLWRRGPPAPAPTSIPVPAAAPAANPSRSARRNANKRNRRRLERGGAAETEDAGSDASASPAESAPPSPGSPAAEEAVSNSDPVRSSSSRRKANGHKRRKLERYAAEAQGGVSQWPLAPSPSTSSEARPSASPKAWPDPVSSPAKPPAPPPSPGSLAQREALRAAEEFFSKDGSDDEGSESESEEEAAAGFFTEMFERDAALRGHYERGWEEGQFACMACAGRKVRRGKGKLFRRCIGLVQHARDARLSGRRGAHRALAAVVCRVLGWDTERLPSIVIDRRGTLGQALAARAPSDVQEAKVHVDTDMKDSNTDGNQVANELRTSKESAEMDNVEETGPLNCRDGSKNNILGHQANQEEDDDTGPTNRKEISRNEVLCTETVQEVSANKDDSLSHGNSGQVYDQEVAKGSDEPEKTNDVHLLSPNETSKNEERCKEVAVQEEENVENK